jgi:hypothetical protein
MRKQAEENAERKIKRPLITVAMEEPEKLCHFLSGTWQAEGGPKQFSITASGNPVTLSCKIAKPGPNDAKFGMVPGANWFTNAIQSRQNPLRFHSNQGANYPDKSDHLAPRFDTPVDVTFDGENLTITRQMRQYWSASDTERATWANSIKTDRTVLRKVP